jgi:N-acetylglucosamine-6-phosphate deacetylase
MIAFTAKSLYTPLDLIEQPLVLVDGQTIVEVAPRRSRPAPQGIHLVDYGEAILAPGFVDIHIHGGGGHDVMEPDAAALPAIQRTLARHGVTSYLPTTVTAPLDATLASLDRLATAIESATKDGAVAGARPVGIHIEGPFLSHARRGVHPPADLLRPTLSTFQRLWEASRGHILVMTIAPELPGAPEVIAEASKRGVCVSMGHSDANLAQARAGTAAGARHVTHIFNAMRPFEHRDPGILGEALTNSLLSAEVIADGLHLDPVTVRLILQAKGLDRTVLVSDATAGTDMPDGIYRLGSFEFEVKDGVCWANGKMAGSILTMDRAVRNLMKFADLDLQQALRPATINPGQVAGGEFGILRPGAPADFVVMNHAGDIRKTIVGGVEI